MLDGMSDSIQGSRIENLQSREVDRQSPAGLIFFLPPYADTKFQDEPRIGDVKYTEVGKICDFQQKSLFILETV